jgi:hypothetical protein
MTGKPEVIHQCPQNRIVGRFTELRAADQRGHHGGGQQARIAWAVLSSGQEYRPAVSPLAA